MRTKFHAILLAVILLLFLSTTVFAAENETGNAPALLVQTEQVEDEMVVTIYLQGCEGVTNGRFLVSYDAEIVLHTESTVSSACGVSSINSQTSGTVAFAWVGSQLTGEPTLLLTLRFQPVGEQAVRTTFTAESDGIYADEELIAVALGTVTVKPDTSALEQAIEQAEALDKTKYTAITYASVEAALTKAKAVLADPESTQAEIDAAVNCLNDALAALELIDTNPNTVGSKIIVLTTFLTLVSAVSFAVLLGKNKRRNHA